MLLGHVCAMVKCKWGEVLELIKLKTLVRYIQALYMRAVLHSDGLTVFLLSYSEIVQEYYVSDFNNASL